MDRVALLLLTALVFLASPVQALALDVQTPPVVASDGTPFQVPVELRGLPEGPVELKAWLGGDGWQASRTYNGTAWQRSDHYAVTVTGPGSWTGRLPVRANPEATHHDRLNSAEQVVVGVRARAQGELVTATVPVAPVDEPERVLVNLTPGQHVHLPGEPGPPLWVHDPQHGNLIEVALPNGVEPPVCLQDLCRPAEDVELLAVGQQAAVLVNRGDRPAPLTGGVLGLPAGRCGLPTTLEAGQTLLVAPESPQTSPPGASFHRCQPQGPGQVNVSIEHLGKRLDSHRSPASGWHVRSVSGDHRWLPWPVPEGILPQAPPVLHVEGQGRGFSTRTDGLSTVLTTIEQAQESLVVATYLFTHQAVATALTRAAARGVQVDLYLEPSPIGGMPSSQEHLLERLEAGGVRVHEATGPAARGLQHAKLVVADGCLALVLTENLTYSGLPPDGQGNLGLGIGLANRTAAKALARTFTDPGSGPDRPCDHPTWPDLQATMAILEAPVHTADPGFVVDLVEGARGPIHGLALTASPRWPHR